MIPVELAPFHQAEARKTAETLFRELPDFFSNGRPPHGEALARNIPKMLARSIKKRDQQILNAALNAGLLSYDTMALARSHPTIAHAAARILQIEPAALQGQPPLCPRLANETIRELRETTTRRCNIQRLLKRTSIDWKDVATIALQGILKGCVTSEQAIYALGDGVAIVQLARAVRLKQAMSAT